MEYEFRAVVVMSDKPDEIDGDYAILDQLLAALKDAGIIVGYASVGFTGEISAELFNSEVL
ncbi:hypothetical protein UFOVP582_15 [uncultured Caudovirales phage]|uniref:Uncharacterized protein n=1 Tax=uncultured Caudovirales phage TaxID=2100421 RepID=A0A6J5MZL2_9CAUD|nr:hypothetical protein UFOVP582_15 [uncultured Caudovirales phage]CAB4184158.1 hypothetical protein UFOVP1099_39 [uncultured Caudovirales phage]CAB4214538.1 hypothetical protein UFOVP1460_44 [uncultured Caudovirales phage]CAB5228793.1 hypothetical protein UFOVP1548_37 [uncultured Caudovirales phage]